MQSKPPVVSSMLCGCRTWWGVQGHVFKFEACPWCCLMRLTQSLCDGSVGLDTEGSVSALNGPGGPTNAKSRNAKFLFS